MITKELDGMLVGYPTEMAIRILKNKKIGAKVRIHAWNWCGVFVKTNDGVTLETNEKQKTSTGRTG
jgi:hypothetical protein